ncbi:MAG: uroporphyrin-III C-methyltransferase / precorrin-2 dehydrogenase / sirohydrochlorin ferrochelatase [Acidobacteriota bacterium]|nr:uroporphyrin-III C-methyltransferase / precorrin-2 dehydrogenase / sirohydrochlorin ferrochelatase [Acidobacteriota bacterium]
MNGKVFLVGAGPGDPDLLTLKAMDLIASADLIAIDALVSHEIVSLIPPYADIVYVGKRSGVHVLPQEEINALLIAEARKGRRVVRLKGGDPFLFGRGAEEAEELTAAGIAVEIVPGISSAIAGPAYAGIPVTHRRFSTSLTIVTAHESEASTGIAWSTLSERNGTIVFMMGLGNLPRIVRKLREHGTPAGKAIAVISKATTSQQRTVDGTLDNIVQRVAEAALETPAVIIVGDVVTLRQSMEVCA